jgi:hypothetical protein
MKRILAIILAVWMVVSTLGCIRVKSSAEEKKDTVESVAETKTEETSVNNKTEAPAPEKTAEPTEEPTPEPTEEPTEEPTPEPTEEPEPDTADYLSDDYDFHVVINDPAWKGSPANGGIAFIHENDSYGTTQIVLYSIDAGDTIDYISMEDMVESVINAWKNAYGASGVTVQTEITEIDVNGISGRMQDADISYIGILLKGRVLIWKAGTRVYLGQLIGVEDGFSEAEPVLQGMLDTFETAADYRSRTGAV